MKSSKFRSITTLAALLALSVPAVFGQTNYISGRVIAIQDSVLILKMETLPDHWIALTNYSGADGTFNKVIRGGAVKIGTFTWDGSPNALLGKSDNRKTPLELWAYKDAKFKPSPPPFK